jgi:hypothetical protein
VSALVNPQDRQDLSRQLLRDREPVQLRLEPTAACWVPVISLARAGPDRAEVGRSQRPPDKGASVASC